MDSTSINQRTNQKIAFYHEQYRPEFKFSSLRLEYLERTVTFLNQYGQVFLVRLPVHEKMLEVEKKLVPDFDEKIPKIIPLTEGYLDISTESRRYEFTDGNHLHKSAGKIVSKEIAEWIKSHQ